MRTLEISCEAIREHYENFPDAEHYRRFCTADWLADWVEFYCNRRLKGHALEISTPKIQVNSRVTQVTLFDVSKMRPTIRLYFTPNKPGETSHVDISMLHCRPVYLGDGEIMLSMWNHGTAILRPYVGVELPDMAYSEEM